VIPRCADCLLHQACSRGPGRALAAAEDGSVWFGMVDGSVYRHAEGLALPSALAFLRVRQGKREVYPTIEEAEAYPWTAEERAAAEKWFAQNVVGSPASVREQLDQLIESTRADELMVLCVVPDAEARKRSHTLLRELHG
jgi:alkanesulfonate monooxygenase SsuD/methylene tetrahydromethanopterin reductase-like flavin-dependent oxidoreductase (luciferase family)